MWAEAGLQFRSNLVRERGGKIPLHAHSYDHVAFVTYGWFKVTEILPTGETKQYQMASKGYEQIAPEAGITYESFDSSAKCRILIPAGHKHEFELIDAEGGPGEVLCVWPE